MAEDDNGKMQVLMLDDERLVRFTIGTYLKASGFNVHEASTPDEAIGILRRTQIHVVVSDVSMGDVDGFMFRDMVRSFNADIPIVFLTAMVNDENNAFMSKLTDDIRSYYVSKSAPRHVLVTRIQQVSEFYRARIGLERSRDALQKSLRLASCVQKSMLPYWASVSRNYAYSCRIRAFESVSGDLMEWYRPTYTTSLVIFGDVSGHGTNAALAMTAIQAFLKQFKHIEVGIARRVHHIASLIHEFISANLRDVAYMAATIVYVDFEACRCRYLNCGNPEPYISHLGDGARRIVNKEAKGGMPLGLIPDAEYHDSDVVEFDFHPGDVYVQMSDGICDVSSDPGGEDRIPGDIIDELVAITIRDQPTKGEFLCELPYRLFGAIYDMGFTHQQDDMSVCVFSPFAKTDGRTYMHRVRMQPGKIDTVSHSAGVWVADRFKSDELGVKAELLLNEHLMNIYRHGYDAFEKQREVCIIAIREDLGTMQVSVWDRGAPWSQIASSSYSAAEAKLDEQNEALAANGRGQAIMKKLTQSISRVRTAGLNRTVFTFALPEEYLKSSGDKS